MSAPSTSPSFTFRNAAGHDVFVRRWIPADKPRAALAVVHGLAEHSGRYEHFARALNDSGFAVYALDRRGHGHTVAPDALGDGGTDSWNGTLEDIALLEGIIRSEYPRLGLFLFGHSLGSVFVQRYMQLHGTELAGAVLSGTFGRVRDLGNLLAMVDTMSAGAAAQQRTLSPATMAGYNKAFENRTGFEWLSRDPAQVDAYVKDPLCGFAVTNGYVRDFLYGFAETWEPANEARVPVTLPILIFSGERDPVGEEMASVKDLAGRYRSRGARDLKVTFYPEGRHEMLNELNRDEVMRDVIGWLREH